MQGSRISFIGLLIIVFITTFGFTQVSLKIDAVYDLAGSTLGDEDFSCSSTSYSTESDCENVGVCSQITFPTQVICEAAGTCSDATKLTEAQCEGVSGTWTSTNTWTLNYTDKASCETASGTWAWTYTWTQTHTWSASGKVDILMSNPTAGCSFCDDILYNTKTLCENNGNNGAGATWSFNTFCLFASSDKDFAWSTFSFANCSDFSAWVRFSSSNFFFSSNSFFSDLLYGS